MALVLNGSTGIVEANIADNAITTSKIASGAVSTGDLASTLDLSSKTISLPSNSSKIVRMYNAYSGTGVQLAGSTPADIGLNFTDVVVNAGESPILFLQVSSRLVTTGQHHCALSMRYTGSATGRLASNPWGFGIMQGASWSWLITNVAGVNLRQLRENPLTANGTFNFYVQAATAGDAVIFGGEVNGSLTAGYCALYGTILIAKD